MVRYGVVRNGEHVKLCETYEEAEQYILACKSTDLDFASQGWITEEQAKAAQYNIQTVKGRRVW